MTDTVAQPQAGAEVLALPAAEVATEAQLEQAQPPAYLDTTDRSAPSRRPVLPVALHRANLRGTVTYAAGLTWHRARYHGARSPWYLLVTLWHALRGAGRLTARLMHWWHWTEGWQLESQAVAAGRPGHHEAMRAHQQGLKTRASRSRIVVACAAVVVLTAGALAFVTPWWAWPLLGAALALVLARHGRPEGKQVVKAAVISPAYQPLTETVVTRGLCATRITEINRLVDGGGHLDFIAPGIGRDGPGWRIVLDLPHGVTVDEVIDRRDKLAAGLRRPLACVWPEGDQQEHPGRLVLYVCDQSLNKARQPAWPLAATAKFSLFGPLPFGTDQRRQPVTMTLMYANLLIGAISRMGKTTAMRNVLLAAALDLSAELHVWELKGTGDLDPIARVAHAYGSGPDDETIEAALADLRKVHAELDRRAKVIKSLPPEQCPHKKVTPHLAAKRSLRLHPLVYAIDECQEAFGSARFRAEFEELCLQLIRRGPALGIMLVLATQRPDAKSLPSAITANIALRFCLKMMDQVSNDMVLGTSAYRRGINATLFAFEDKGIGYAVGLGPEPLIVKTYDIDTTAADRIALRAGLAREAAGTLTGYAAGQDAAEPPRDFLADVLAMFDGDRNLYSTTIAARLGQRLPAVYAGISASAVSAQLRALDITVKKVREAGGTAGWGAERAAIEAATQ